uniref:Leucine-rich repeat-containing N-terminal plant-type domain-containing protein n=1 Tax=Setaria italica TaxID=4555 RepID=K3Z023_SETIT
MPFFALALALLLSWASPTTSCTAQERTSLLRFLAGLSQDGGLTESWRNGTSCCTWEGIICNVNGTVSEVSLGSRGLEGRISPSLGDLSSLLRLNLSSNFFTGSLPTELMSSSSIVVLDVSSNRLSGALKDLKSSASDMPLQLLNISSNQLTGKLPSTMWEKTRGLVMLNASNNSFTGQILLLSASAHGPWHGHVPNQLGNCSALRVLKAGRNNLTGALPDELFNTTLLEHLSFHSNSLEGTIGGQHVIKLRNLVILNLGRNKFRGTIPASIGHLGRLEELHLNKNDMSGELPSSIGNCTNLRVINLRSNIFGGTLQKVNFSSLLNLKFLDLLLNDFSGEIPESIYSCSNLIGLRLSTNKFNGQLSPRIGNLKSLSFLSISINNFVNITGALHALKNSRNLTSLLMGVNFVGEVMPDPMPIDGFENLQILSIHSCQLSGKLPLWLSKLTSLRILKLSNNKLTGTIPVWISTLNFLYHIDMSNNSFIGEIPTALMEMPMLQSKKVPDYMNQRVFIMPIYMSASSEYRMLGAFPTTLNLGNNKFTGAIPPEIGQLKALLVLNLSFNKLHGEIPQSTGNLTRLQELDLSSNHLIGTIPPAMKSLHFLAMLNVSNNDLEGAIPTGGQFTTFSNSSFEGNPKLCGPMLAQHCNSAEPPLTSTVSKEQTYEKVIFVVAFCTFFVVGVLYDQIILS